MGGGGWLYTQHRNFTAADVESRAVATPGHHRRIVRCMTTTNKSSPTSATVQVVKRRWCEARGKRDRSGARVLWSALAAQSSDRWIPQVSSLEQWYGCRPISCGIAPYREGRRYNGGSWVCRLMKEVDDQGMEALLSSRKPRQCSRGGVCAVPRGGGW